MRTIQQKKIKFTKQDGHMNAEEDDTEESERQMEAL